jgi:phosphoribosylglycinamide formyltransferase-1
MNIAVFASHGGSDLQAIIDGCKQDKLNATVAVVINGCDHSPRKCRI